MLAERSIGTLVFVRLLRKWSATRTSGENPLPFMQTMVLRVRAVSGSGAGLREPVRSGGRTISDGRWCPIAVAARSLSRDEEALLSVAPTCCPRLASR